MNSQMPATILVVDDSAEFRMLLIDELLIEGYTVFEAESKNGALKLIAEKHVDLIVTDVQMPGGDGLELLREINASQSSAPPVIVMSGFSNYTEEEIMAHGAAAFIAKPFNLNRFIEVVQVTFNGGRASF